MSFATPEFLHFAPMKTIAPRKTGIWAVYSRQGERLGEVRWHGAWHQYVFVPRGETIWSAGCMAALNEFIEKQMAERLVPA